MKRKLLKIRHIIEKWRLMIMYLSLMLPLLIVSYKETENIWDWNTDLTTYTVFTTVIFAFFAYVSNTYSNRGILFFKIIETNNKQYIEITNVGGVPTYNIELKIYDISSDSKELIFANKEKFNLKQGDSKYLLIENDITKILINGEYSTKGGLIQIRESLLKGDPQLLSNITDNE